MPGPSEFKPHAVYRYFSGDGRLLYIGMGLSPGTRMADHQRKHPDWFPEVRGVTLEWFPDEYAARVAERIAVILEKPAHNGTYANDPSVDLAANRVLDQIRIDRRALSQANLRIRELKTQIAALTGGNAAI